MAGKILTQLEHVHSDLVKNEANILESKKALADALRFNGITNVSDTETFARYAVLIRKLKNANSMVFQFTIPDTALTDYKRTVVLPMEFGKDGNKGYDLNIIAKEVIANDKKTYSVAARTMPLGEEGGMFKVADVDPIENHIIKDVYGNDIIEGDYVAPFTMNDIHNYLGEDEQEELISAMNNLGIMPLAASDEPFEPDATQQYSFVVDWGDETGEFNFDHSKTAEENKKAIFHTYSKPGTYDVTITGSYKRIYTQGRGAGAFNENNVQVKDADGSYGLLNQYNYAMINHLVEMIAWGNTGLTSMANAFEGCAKLTTIPMYDTTNSFNEVTTFASAFAYCTSLASLPFNENTQKGLFSGCEKATTFQSCFQNCTGIKGSIPPRLIDGCSKVTTTASMFQSCTGISGKIPVDMIKGLTELTNASSMFNGCTGIDDELTPNLFDTCPKISNVASMYQGCTKLHGNIPQEMFKGITTLTTANNLFSGCTGLNGEIPNDLFEDCELITTISEIFNGCKGIVGKIKKGAFSNLKKLTSMQRAFRNCSGIEGFESGAFEHLEANGLNCFEAFENCTSIQEIPDNLLDGITGLNVRIERMFPDCTGITRIGKGNFSPHERTVRVRDEEGNYSEETVMFNGHKPADARGIFGGCTSIEEIVDLTENIEDITEWKEENIKRWYGAFACCAISEKPDSPVYAELGGYGKRISKSEVGKIVLSNRSMVEIKDFTYDSENPPVALVYADVYLDPAKMIPTLPNVNAVDGVNVVPDKTPGAVHKIYASVFNDITKQWTNGQANAEDITTITNTSNWDVSYSRYKWTEVNVPESGEKTYSVELNPTRYNGESYTKAINEWRVAKNMATYVDGKYTKTDTDKYDAVDYCMTYMVHDKDQQCFLPDGADLWTQYMIRSFQKAALNKIISETGGSLFTTSNTNPIRTGTYYWASAESSSTGAWGCYTGYAGVGSNGKWGSGYVRPSLAIDVEDNPIV